MPIQHDRRLPGFKPAFSLSGFNQLLNPFACAVIQHPTVIGTETLSHLLRINIEVIQANQGIWRWVTDISGKLDVDRKISALLVFQPGQTGNIVKNGLPVTVGPTDVLLQALVLGDVGQCQIADHTLGIGHRVNPNFNDISLA